MSMRLFKSLNTLTFPNFVTPVSKAKRMAPVSYTHLDVYKRQLIGKMEVLVGLIGRKSNIPAGWMPIRINERSRLTVPFQRNLLYLPMINQVSPIMRTPLMKKHLFPLSLTKGMAVHTTIICRLVIKNRLFNIVFNTSLINPYLCVKRFR